MTDVNEEIVAKYFELNGYLVYKNLKYMIKKKKSSGESDIDLAVYKIDTGEKAIVEVKGWHTESFSITHFTCKDPKDYRSRIFHFLREESQEAAKAFFGSNDFKNLLVLSKLPENIEKRNKILKLLSEKRVEVLEFKDILKFVINKTEINKNYRDSEFQQALRLLKNYNLLKDE